MSNNKRAKEIEFRRLVSVIGLKRNVIIKKLGISLDVFKNFQGGRTEVQPHIITKLRKLKQILGD